MWSLQISLQVVHSDIGPLERNKESCFEFDLQESRKERQKFLFECSAQEVKRWRRCLRGRVLRGGFKDKEDCARCHAR